MKLLEKLVAFAAVTLILVAGAAQAAGTVNVTLSGAEEVPPVTTSGSGTGSFTVGDDGSISGGVTTTGVPGTMAHIHAGAKGQNGGVIVPLAKSGDTYTVPAGVKLTEGQLAAFKAGNLYVNVHTATNKGGEVRGQLQP